MAERKPNYAHYMREIYAGGARGTKPLTTSYDRMKEQAKAILAPEAFGYVDGSASSGSTDIENREGFKRWHIVPQHLRGVDVEKFDASTRLFGRTYKSPVIVAPIGVQEQLYPDGADSVTARAAKELEIPFTLSSAASVPLEEVHKLAGFSKPDQEQGSDAWYQLYWPKDNDITASLLHRAQQAGYRVLVITLDTWMLGWRPRDLETAYNPFVLGKGVANVFSDPVFQKKYLEGKASAIDPRGQNVTKEEHSKAAQLAISQLSPGISRSWSDLSFVRKHWKGPIVLKGIQSRADAVLAIEAGMDGVWVSNHGGRQVDGAGPSLDRLPVIAEYINSLPVREGEEKKTIIFDSGIRVGADIFKALALGADAVAVGRPWCWGLAAAGEEGVKHVFKCLLADFEIGASLAGFQSAKEITKDALVRSQY